MEELEWIDIIDYLENNHVSEKKKEQIFKILDKFDNDIDFQDIIDYLKSNSLDSGEENDLLDTIGHYCEEELANVCKYSLPVENLMEEQKFEVVRNLYNNLTLEQLQRIEKRVKIRII